MALRVLQTGSHRNFAFAIAAHGKEIRRRSGEPGHGGVLPQKAGSGGAAEGSALTLLDGADEIGDALIGVLPKRIEAFAFHSAFGVELLHLVLHEHLPRHELLVVARKLIVIALLDDLEGTLAFFELVQPFAHYLQQRFNAIQPSDTVAFSRLLAFRQHFVDRPLARFWKASHVHAGLVRGFETRGTVVVGEQLGQLGSEARAIA